MKKSSIRVTALAMAMLMSLSVNMPVYALETQETELVLEGQAEAVTAEGVTDAGVTKIGQKEMKTALVKAQSMMKQMTVNPSIGTLGGEWSVMALARHNNLDAQVKTNYLVNVYKALDEKKGVLHTAKYTEYSRVIMALTAIGVDASHVHNYDLVHWLADYNKVKFQGINGPIFALIALDTNHYEMPQLTKAELAKGKVQASREMFIDFILKSERKNGGWSMGETEADPDITAMAIQALTPYYDSMPEVKAAVDRALNRLSEIQLDSGGFESWGTVNLESCAQVVIALAGLDVSLLEDDMFIKNGHSILEAMLSFQNEDGSFSHVQGEGKDGMATDQGTLALVAYERAVNGKNRLYDMTDAGQSGGGDTEETDDVEDFVKRLYTNILQREADASGLKAWTDVLKSGKEQGAKVAQGFIESPEFQKRKLTDTQYLEILYQTFFDRKADKAGLDTWLGVLDSGLSRMHVFKGFAESNEFTEICEEYGIIRGNVTLTAPMDQNEGVTKFIVRCYRLCLGRDADKDGLNSWCTQILTGKNTVKEAAHGFVFSDEFIKKNLSDKEYVKTMYRVFMDREADKAGLDAWVKVLKSGKSREHVFNGFADSGEFKEICAEYGIR